MKETVEARRIRQRGEHYRQNAYAQRNRRYRHDAEYRETCKARANAYHARKRAEA